MVQESSITTTQSIVLDLIRFFCSQGVLLGHLFYFGGVTNAYIGGLASYCVLIFFILSGFLISYSVRQKLSVQPTYNFSAFFRDRFFRIYPPLIGTLILVFILDMIGFHLTGQIYSLKIYGGNFMLNILQLQEFPLATYINEHYMIEFFRFHYFGSNLPLWTISIEWWLYMLAGFFFFYFILNDQRRPWHYLILIFLCISPAYYMLVSARMEKGLTAYWFLGVLITLCIGKRILPQPSRMLKRIVPLGIFAGIISYSALGYHGAILVFFISLFLFMTTCRNEWKPFNHFVGRAAKLLAGYSYSLYLIHYSILYFITLVFHPDFSLWQLIMIYLLVNIIAFLFAQLFEKHSKKLQLSYENYRSQRH